MLNKLVGLVSLILVSGLSLAVEARQYVVSLPEVATCLQQAQSGDRIILRAGVYKDVVLKWNAQGSAEHPIVIEAETSGTVVITGQSSIQVTGSHLTIRGLYFKDVSPVRRGVLDFSIGNRYAYYCRLTECVFDNCNTARRDLVSSYIVLSGRHNRVDHCSLVGKRTLGVTLLVNLNGEECLQNYHQIDHNYFGPRDVYGSNGAETMRIGTSQQSYMSSNTIVEDNLFERCNGEVEVISVKSCDNIVRRNTLVECEGVVALRHGRRNKVEDNWFIGNGRRNTGGVRIVDADHLVTGNVFYRLAGRRFFSALGVMYGVPNSLPNRYVRVENVTITGNTFFDCQSIDFETGKDPERTEAPQHVTFENNKIISGTSGKAPQLPDMKKTRRECGASWMPAAETVMLSDAVVTCSQQDDIVACVRQAAPGSTVVLTGQDYRIAETILIDKPLTIRAERQAVIRFVGQTTASMMTIANGGSLKVQNIVFDGVLEPGKRLADAGIATASEMNKTYRLEVNDCIFRNFNESGFSAIKGGKATFADSVLIRGCAFYDISGNGIDYAAERDDKGRYNADDIIIENCRFHRFLGIPVNIYRGGSDESTAGPYVRISGCSFDDCCNRQRGSVMRLIGPQLLEVSGCRFVNSGLGGASIRLDEAIWEDITIHHCSFEHSGRIMTSTNRVVTYDNTIR